MVRLLCFCFHLDISSFLATFMLSVHLFCDYHDAPAFLTDDASSVFHRHMLLHKDPSTYDHSSVFYFSSSVPPFCGPWWFFGSWLIQCVLSPFAFTQISCCYHHSSELPFDRYHHHSSLLNISFLAFPFQSKVQLTKAPMFTIWGRITSQRSAVTDSDKKMANQMFRYHHQPQLE